MEPTVQVAIVTVIGAVVLAIVNKLLDGKKKAEQSNRIDESKGLLSDYDKHFARLDQIIADLRTTIIERDKTIASQATRIAELEATQWR